MQNFVKYLNNFIISEETFPQSELPRRNSHQPPPPLIPGGPQFGSTPGITPLFPVRHPYPHPQQGFQPNHSGFRGPPGMFPGPSMRGQPFPRPPFDHFRQGNRGPPPPFRPPMRPGMYGAGPPPPGSSPMSPYGMQPLVRPGVPNLPPVMPLQPPAPRKVLINPNFKGGVEAVTSQLLKERQIFNPTASLLSDDELLRKQEEFITRNLIHVEKRKHEGSPPPRRSRSRSYSPQRRRRSRSRSRERPRGRRYPPWRRNNDGNWRRRRSPEREAKRENHVSIYTDSNMSQFLGTGLGTEDKD